MGGQILKLANFVELEVDSDSEGAVLINSRSGVIYSCNASAVALISEIAKGAELEKLAEHLTRHFEVTADRALRDIGQFIDALRSAGLLVVLEPAMIAEPG